MIKISIMIGCILLLQYIGYTQINKEPGEVTKGKLEKIKASVEKEAQLFKTKLMLVKTNSVVLEFMLDTFIVERISEQKINLVSTDVDMSRVTFETAKGYDSLLNKYYKKLLAVLKPVDKDVLVAAQKAWIFFREKERKLFDTISKEEYSGGGTIQQLDESGEYLTMVKNRVITIFQHLQRTTQNY